MKSPLSRDFTRNRNPKPTGEQLARDPMHHKEDRSVFSVPIVQSFNRFALQGIEPFQSFQPFHRFAPFTPFNPIQVVQRSTVQWVIAITSRTPMCHNLPNGLLQQRHGLVCGKKLTPWRLDVAKKDLWPLNEGRWPLPFARESRSVK